MIENKMFKLFNLFLFILTFQISEIKLGKKGCSQNMKNPKFRRWCTSTTSLTLIADENQQLGKNFFRLRYCCDKESSVLPYHTAVYTWCLLS